MARELTCPACGEHFEVPSVDPDKGLVCPTCGVRIGRGAPDEPKSPAPGTRKRGRGSSRKKVRLGAARAVDREHVPVFAWYLAATIVILIATLYDYFNRDVIINGNVYRNPNKSIVWLGMTAAVAGCVGAARHFRGQWQDDEREIHEPPKWLVAVLGVLGVIALSVGAEWRPLLVVYALVLVAALWYVLRHKIVVYREELAELTLMLGIWVVGMCFLFSSGGTPPAPSDGGSVATPSAPSDGGRTPAPPAPPNGGNAPAPPLPDDPALGGPGTYFLSDLHDQAYVAGPWALGKNGEIGNPEHSPIEVNKMPYPKGLGMHPPLTGGEARVSYVLGGKAKRFKGAVAVNDNGGAGGPVFKVVCDDRSVWESVPVKQLGVAEQFDIDVSGVKVLQLRVFVGGSSAHGCYAVWLDPYVEVE
jgi:hypothetical protein